MSIFLVLLLWYFDLNTVTILALFGVNMAIFNYVFPIYGEIICQKLTW